MITYISDYIAAGCTLGIPIGENLPRLLSVVAHELDTYGMAFCGFILVSNQSSFTDTTYRYSARMHTHLILVASSCLERPE